MSTQPEQPANLTQQATVQQSPEPQSTVPQLPEQPEGAGVSAAQQLSAVQSPARPEPVAHVDAEMTQEAASADVAQMFRGLEIWPLETPRLALRPAELTDSAALWRHRGLPEVGKWLGWHPVDRADWDVTYPEKYRDYLVVELEGNIIGDLMLRIGDGWGQREVKEQTARVQAELGWTFAPAVGGNGYATEAVAALISVCFDHIGLRRIEAGAFAENEPSWRLMERVGMRRESYSVEESLHRDLGWLDGVLYAMLADEWHAQ